MRERACADSEDVASQGVAVLAEGAATPSEACSQLAARPRQHERRAAGGEDCARAHPVDVVDERGDLGVRVGFVAHVESPAVQRVLAEDGLMKAVQQSVSGGRLDSVCLPARTMRHTPTRALGTCRQANETIEIHPHPPFILPFCRSFAGRRVHRDRGWVGRAPSVPEANPRTNINFILFEE